MSFLESIESQFGTQNLYEALGLEKTAKETEIKRAYHKLSLKTHPDRVPPNEVTQATEKFQVYIYIFFFFSCLCVIYIHNI